MQHQYLQRFKLILHCFRMGHSAFSHQTLPSRPTITGSHQPSFSTNRGQMHQTGHPAFGGKFTLI